MRFSAPVFALRALAGVAFGILWLAACLHQPGVSADSAADEPSEMHFDELSTSVLVEHMTAAAAKLAAADAEARASFSSEERRRWDFWPSRYPGLRMDQAGADGRESADELLRLGLSESGYGKLRLIQALEPLNPWSSPYYSALVFGDPAVGKAWGWRYQGHHMSVNFTMTERGGIVTTPLFLGTQPLSSPATASGARPLGDEEALARELYRALDGQQRRQATIERPPYTYLPERTAQPPHYAREGVSAASLSAANRETLQALIDSYIGNVAPAAATAWRDAFESDGEDVRFAWAGSDQPGRDHYYRILGGDLLIEYDSRDGGSHIHSVWRSMSRDFGGDPLRAHYTASPHSPATGW
jgi:hypothetical protein